MVDAYSETFGKNPWKPADNFMDEVERYEFLNKVVLKLPGVYFFSWAFSLSLPLIFPSIS